MKNKLHPLTQDCWVFEEAKRSKPKTHFLEDNSEAKTNYHALKSTIRSLVPCGAITFAFKMLTLDNVHVLAPMETHCLETSIKSVFNIQ